MYTRPIAVGIILLVCIGMMLMYRPWHGPADPPRSPALVSPIRSIPASPARSTSRPASQTPSPTVTKAPSISPTDFVPTITPNVQQLSIYKVFPDRGADGPPWFRGWNSMWHIGAVPSHDPYEWLDLYVLARSPFPVGRTPKSYGEMQQRAHATLATGLGGNGITQETGRQFMDIWECPEDVGTITITDVQGPTVSSYGPTGTVFFTTSNNRTGTFDLATHQWHLSQ